jgi:hypothetical protein
MAQDVLDWLQSYARLRPLGPVPDLQLLTELRREVLAVISIAQAVERGRCAQVALDFGQPSVARLIRGELPGG